MTQQYTKTPLTIEGQLKRLERRGLVVNDRRAAFSTLANINYYRLSGYWYIFKEPDNTFGPAGSFELAVKLYRLDHNLRLLVSDSVAQIEIALRSQVSQQLAMSHGTFAHERPAAWAEKYDIQRWRAELHRETKRSKETFARHFEKTYQEWPKLPIWVAVELMSFGTLSKLFKSMRTEDRRAVAARFSCSHKVLASWLHMLVYTRNICAHHGRLWNRTLSIQGHLPRSRRVACSWAWVRDQPSVWGSVRAA